MAMTNALLNEDTKEYVYFDEYEEGSFPEEHLVTLNEAIPGFNCITGVVYQDNENEEQLLMPHHTGAKTTMVDCTIINKQTREEINAHGIVDTGRLGEPVGYKG